MHGFRDTTRSIHLLPPSPLAIDRSNEPSPFLLYPKILKKEKERKERIPFFQHSSLFPVMHTGKKTMSLSRGEANNIQSPLPICSLFLRGSVSAGISRQRERERKKWRKRCLLFLPIISPRAKLSSFEHVHSLVRRETSPSPEKFYGPSVVKRASCLTDSRTRKNGRLRDYSRTS